MSEYYQVKEIEGKGTGCVALKEIKPGIMILQEKPQLKLKCGNWSFRDLAIAFKQMSDDEDDEYLNLYNRFENFEALNERDQAKINEWTQGLKENLVSFNEERRKAILKIIGIYATNCFENGVCIKMARFNHSCRSNAEHRWNEKTESREIRIVTKINKDDEITINYAMNNSMQDFPSRQEKLLNWGFICKCERCEEEKSNKNNDNEVYRKFDKIMKKAKKLNSDYKNNHPICNLDQLMLEVICYEELYKLAKEKKVSWSFIIDHILDYGFKAAFLGFLCSQRKIENLEIISDLKLSEPTSDEIQKISEHQKKFRVKCESFSTAAEKIAMTVWGKDNGKYLERKKKKTELDEMISAECLKQNSFATA